MQEIDEAICLAVWLVTLIYDLLITHAYPLAWKAALLLAHTQDEW